MCIDTRNIEGLFPLTQSALDPLAEDEWDDDDDNTKIEGRLLEAKRQLSWLQRQPIEDEVDNTKRPGSLHQRYETIHDLSGPAKAFHDRAAKLAGLPTEKLLRAVFKLEQLLMYWTDHRKKGTVEPLDSDVEGVESRSLARMLNVKQI